MRDAAGQLPDRLHLLGLTELFLGPSAFGNIAKGHGKDLLAAQVELGDGSLRGKFGPVLAQAGDLAALGHHEAGRFPGLVEALDMASMDGANTPRQQHVQRFSDRFLGIVAENVPGPLIEHDDGLVLIHRNDRFGGDVQDARQAHL